jgi:site-specific DNA recombinase
MGDQRAFVVLRNSTDKQAKAGTIAAQRRPVRELAERCGATDLIEYKEEGVSGAAPLDERDVMLRLLSEAKPGDLVCAFDLSRLTRAESMLQRYKVLGHLADAGVRIATVEDGEIDLSTIGGRITLHVKGEIASDERQKIRARLTSGKENAAREGRKPQGATPYGWHYDRATRVWSLAEPQAMTRRELLQRILDGESTVKVAATFNARAVPYPARQGAQPGWTSRRVWHFATQSINKGEWIFDGHHIAVPALVDGETFARVLAILSGNQQRAGRARTQHVYLLDEDHGRCGLCNAPLRLHWGGRNGEHSYYVCARRLHDKACDLPWWRTDEADTLVWDKVKRVLERPDLVEEALRERIAEKDVDGGLAAKDVQKGQARLAHLANTRAIFMRQAAKGNIPEDELDRELDRLSREARLLEQTVAAARDEAERARAAVTEISNVRAWLDVVAQRVKNAGASERRRICRALAPKVEIDRDQIRIGVKLREHAERRLGSTCS